MWANNAIYIYMKDDWNVIVVRFHCLIYLGWELSLFSPAVLVGEAWVVAFAYLPYSFCSEPCGIAEHSFREIEAFRRFDEDDKWVCGVFGNGPKQRKYRK